jgi:hypothetical protein
MLAQPDLPEVSSFEALPEIPESLSLSNKTIMLANITAEIFIKCGWGMWTILATFFLALCVLLDRATWWLKLQGSLRFEAGSLYFPRRDNLTQPFPINDGGGTTPPRPVR